MRLLAEPDATQAAILPHLQVTEQLLARAVTASSGREGDAEIIGMPDLGLPHNVRRIHGGFFTGAYYSWSSDVPFVPVDATVNVCGVGLYRVSSPAEDETTFRTRVRTALARAAADTTYVGNFASGNHFVLLTEVTEGQAGLAAGRYLVLHASSAEFKKQYNGLYPEPGNWFSHRIRVVEGPGNRYLRYIDGTTAEQFFRRAELLVDYQRDRLRTFAELIAGPDGIEEEVLSVPHYGMPDASSIAIGCQWMNPAAPDYVLLTRPTAPVYLVRATPGAENVVATDAGERMLTPHGLGVRSTTAPRIEYEPSALTVNGTSFALNESLADRGVVAIREFDGRSTVDAALASTPGDVLAELTQLAAFHRNGEK